MIASVISSESEIRINRNSDESVTYVYVIVYMPEYTTTDLFIMSKAPLYEKPL